MKWRTRSDRRQRGPRWAPKKAGLLHTLFGAALALGIELLVRFTGRRVRPRDQPWLSCFLGDSGPIGAGIYQRIADSEHLELRTPALAGLIPPRGASRQTVATE